MERRERINEIYQRVWNPIPREGEGLPYTPDDHIHITRLMLDMGIDPATSPVVAVVAKEDPELAREYERLLVEAAEEWTR